MADTKDKGFEWWLARASFFQTLAGRTASQARRQIILDVARDYAVVAERLLQAERASVGG